MRTAWYSRKQTERSADLEKHIQLSRRAEERLFFFVQLHGHWFWAEVLARGPRGTQTGLPHHLVYASPTVTWPCLTTLRSTQLMLRLIMASFPRTTCADFFTTLGWQCFCGLPFHCKVKSTAHTGVMTSSSCLTSWTRLWTDAFKVSLALINSPFSVSTHSVERDHALTNSQNVWISGQSHVKKQAGAHMLHTPEHSLSCLLLW